MCWKGQENKDDNPGVRVLEQAEELEYEEKQEQETAGRRETNADPRNCILEKGCDNAAHRTWRYPER